MWPAFGVDLGLLEGGCYGGLGLINQEVIDGGDILFMVWAIKFTVFCSFFLPCFPGVVRLMNKTSERVLEDELIAKLCDLKYVYRKDIRDRAALEANFREKFESLNRVSLTDGEFKRLLDEIVTSDVFKASLALRNPETFIREDGTSLHYTLVNVEDWCKNTFEVVNQLRINTDYGHHRYDVVILINGLPLVQIELKSLGISPKAAMKQIVDYKNDAGNGYTRTLLCFMQLFIVSNRTDTWYFANNNAKHFAFDADERFLPVCQFADRDNTKIPHLDVFADRFLRKCTLGQMISRYMVLVASERKLVMMRPYQIYAVQAIMDCIEQNRGNGYIWHTTGSGKTLTSFKASTLLKGHPDIYKCLFVVDRKDLDRQTRDEFNRFQANCVEENTNTAGLVKRLLSTDYADKVIVTTIQKLGLALRSDRLGKADAVDTTFRFRLESLRDERMVFIFDECHRSQFGENHQAIKEFFPKAQLFGFTGTPIFEPNAATRQFENNMITFRTTEDLFEKELHAYTISHAIEDDNVLRFHIDYYQSEEDAINQAPAREAVVGVILDKHDTATNNRRFNALLATHSINDAIAYYKLFKETQEQRQLDDPDFVPLKIAAVFSPPAEGNKDVQQLQDDLLQEKADNRHDPDGKKRELTAIIADYNRQYGTNRSLNDFDRYYQDVQERLKNQEFSDGSKEDQIDIAIVVDMLLTGFDAKYLNTLYVDKPLQHHGLIQAFSRTNRVLNGTKPFGQIVDFRQQQDNVDKAIELFSGQHVEQARMIWLVDKAPVVIDRFKQAVTALGVFMETHGLEVKPSDVNNLRGDEARMQFMRTFQDVKQLRTQLDRYTDLTVGEQEEIEDILPTDDLQGFSGAYLEIARRLRKKPDQTINGVVKEPPEPLALDLVLFNSAIIDYDYIMKLMARYSGQDPQTRKITREELIGMIQSDAKFWDEHEDIIAYVESLTEGAGLDEMVIREGYETFKKERQAKEVAELAQKHGLPVSCLAAFVDTIVQRLVFDGEELTDLMAPLAHGWRERRQRELDLMGDLVPFLRKRAQGREISGLRAYEQGATP